MRPFVEVLMENLHNLSHDLLSQIIMEQPMNGLTGMEKFSHLEDKIYLTIEFAKNA